MPKTSDHVKKAKRWQRYGYLGVTHFPKSALTTISHDTEMSDETRRMAADINAALESLRVSLAIDLKAMDKRNKKNAEGK